jgi:hypothetical protein
MYILGRPEGPEYELQSLDMAAQSVVEVVAVASYEEG